MKALSLTYALLATLTLAEYQQLLEDFELDAHLDPSNPEYAIFKLKLKKDTWVGLALGSLGMKTGTDMIQIDGDNLKAYDMTSRGYMFPEIDAE